MWRKLLNMIEILNPKDLKVKKLSPRVAPHATVDLSQKPTGLARFPSPSSNTHRSTLSTDTDTHKPY